MNSSKVRPYVTRTDFVLLVVATGLNIVFDWLCYRDGLHAGLASFLIAPLILLGTLVLGLIQFLRPWVLIPRDKRLPQLWIRPLLVAVSCLTVWAAHHWSPFSSPGMMPFAKGQLHSIQHLVNEEHMNALRSIVAEKAKLLGEGEKGTYLPEAEMPDFLKTSAWGVPQRVMFSSDVRGTEIEVMWGSGLIGHFGFLIDPGPSHAYDRRVKLAENVYFFY